MKIIIVHIENQLLFSEKTPKWVLNLLILHNYILIIISITCYRKGEMHHEENLPS